MFITGFTKISMDKKRAAALGALGAYGAYIAGIGAINGHAAHVNKKMIYARAGKDYKEKSFIDKHPKLTGAATFGIAPLTSMRTHQRALDLENPKVRKVMKDHPHVTGGL